MARLLTLSGKHIRLEPKKSYVLGRGIECDIPVEDLAASRRHAQIVLGRLPHIVMVDDLGSRNGTFVDDKPVKDRILLTEGSRLRIGGTVFLLSFDDNPEITAPNLEETHTRSFSWDAGSESNTRPDFSGRLSSFNLVDVIQFLHHTRKQGTVHFSTPDGHAEMGFRAGELWCVRCANERGFAALVRLAGFDDGFFWLDEDTLPRDREINRATSGLLLDLCHAMDEQVASS